MIPNELRTYLESGGVTLLLGGYIRLLDCAEREQYTHYVEPITTKWENTEVFGLTAFGDLLVWDGRYVHLFRLAEDRSEVISSGFSFFFKNIEDKDYQKDYFDMELFEKAQNRLGPLQGTECFAFEPIPLLGGERTLESITKTTAENYIRFLISLY